ncbi:MAG TPA: histidine phosphatase family protein [Caulobacteraceae bacterium]|jgi:broad specificity phosphatase PhoE
MAKLVLVKHAPPQIVDDVASHRWVLSEAGRGRCDWLALQLADQGVTQIYASLEPKALETAALTAVRLGLEMRPRRGLHENDRTGLGFLPMEELRARIERFFAEPSMLVIGTETAEAAGRRFEAAVRALQADAGDADVAVITHGTVLTTLVARYNDVAPFAFWDSLTVPSVVVLDGATFGLDGPPRTFTA